MMGKLLTNASAWTIALVPACLFGLIGSIKLLIWCFDVGDFITGQGAPPWPFR
jgi:hypothetical protein